MAKCIEQGFSSTSEFVFSYANASLAFSMPYYFNVCITMNGEKNVFFDILNGPDCVYRPLEGLKVDGELVKTV